MFIINKYSDVDPLVYVVNYLYRRCLVAKLRRLEKEIYLVQKTIIEEENTEDLLTEIERLEIQVRLNKKYNFHFPFLIN